MTFGIERLGFWAPGFPNAETWFAGTADEDEIEPACAVVAGRAKRGTSRITRMLGEVATQAAEGGQFAATPVVFASAWGEIETMVALLDQIVGGGEGLSPIRFKNSVHNAASGLVSIATGNQSFSTAIAAGSETFECGMLEAFSALSSNREVILVVGDDQLPAPLDQYSEYEAAAVAIRFSQEASEESLAQIGFPRYSYKKSMNHEKNPTDKAFPLLRAIHDRTAGALLLGSLEVDLSFRNEGE